jgi:hypothetical protein
MTNSSNSRVSIALSKYWRFSHLRVARQRSFEGCVDTVQVEPTAALNFQCSYFYAS